MWISKQLYRPYSVLCRLVVLLLICLATHSTFLVEQPEGSKDVFPHHPRFSWFTNRICMVPFLKYPD